MSVPDLAGRDQNDEHWSLHDHLDAGVVAVTLRGDW